MYQWLVSLLFSHRSLLYRKYLKNIRFYLKNILYLYLYRLVFEDKIRWQYKKLNHFTNNDQMSNICIKEHVICTYIHIHIHIWHMKRAGMLKIKISYYSTSNTTTIYLER